MICSPKNWLSGLIPAHAGKTPRNRRSFPDRRAHPRSRGENRVPTVAAIAGPGSSPLTRGKPDGDVFSCVHDGLIPAHAGKTPSTGACRGRWRAHPRSRGENSMRSSAASLRVGSSPLTRGKQCETRHTHMCTGLIPAHAGKTAVMSLWDYMTWAHPRSRGENLSFTFLCLLFPGSSPLTRGKPAGRDVCVNVRGLIPAHAGKTGS